MPLVYKDDVSALLEPVLDLNRLQRGPILKNPLDITSPLEAAGSLGP